MNELVTFARANGVDESRRFVGRGAPGVPRKHERITVDTCHEGERWRAIAVHAGSRLAFQQIDSESREAAAEVLTNVRGKPPAIVRVPLLGQLALLRQEAKCQTNQKDARSAERRKEQQRRARRPEDHDAYSTDSPPIDLS